MCLSFIYVPFDVRCDGMYVVSVMHTIHTGSDQFMCLYQRDQSQYRVRHREGCDDDGGLRHVMSCHVMTWDGMRCDAMRCDVRVICRTGMRCDAMEMGMGWNEDGMGAGDAIGVMHARCRVHHP